MKGSPWKTNFSGEGSAPYYGLNLAIEGDFTQSLLWRLKNGLLTTNDLPPKVAFLLIGTNNTSWKTPSRGTAEGVWAIVEHLKAATRGQTKIVVYGLLPRGGGVTDWGTVANRYVNQELKMYASAHGYTYRDIWNKFLHKDGTLNRDLLYDGLHSGPKGFEVFAEDILKALKKLKVPPARAGGTDNR